jgi:hypothetical protein
VAAIRLSPFSRLELDRLSLTPIDSEAVLTGGYIRARYDLIEILKGRIVVEELVMDSATVNMVTSVDGRSNLDGFATSKTPGATKTSPSAAPLIDIRSIVLTNVTVRRVQLRADCGKNMLQIQPVNLQARDLKNNATGKYSFDAVALLDQPAGTNTPPARLAATLRGNISLGLDAALNPAAIQSQVVVESKQAQGALADLAGMAITLDADVLPAQIKQMNLMLQRGNDQLSRIHLSGPFDLSKREGKLTLEMNSLSPHLAQFAGALLGKNFGQTVLSSTNEIEIAKSGGIISVFGETHAKDFQIVNQAGTTPRLALDATYSVAVDQTRESAVIGAFQIQAAQSGRKLLTAGLTSPMTVTWGKSADTAGASALAFSITEFRPNEWSALLGDTFPAGKIRAEGKIKSEADGKILNYEIKVNATDLAVRTAGRRLSDLTVAFDATGDARELTQFKITEFGAQVFQDGQPAFSFQGAASHDLAAGVGDAEISLLASLPQLAPLLGAEPGGITSGVFEFNGSLSQKQGTNTATGKARLVDLTGEVAGNAFDRFGADLEVDLAATSSLITLRRGTGNFSGNSKPGGKLAMGGTYAPPTGAGRFSLELYDLNQNGLRPFLEPRFPGKKLNTASLRVNVSATLSKSGAKSFKSEIALTNLTTTEVRSGRVSEPLFAVLQCDVEASAKAARIRQCTLAITPTADAKNLISLAGNLSFPQTNRIGGALKLSADSLDLTAIHALVTSPAPATSTKPGVPSPSPAPEPSAIQFNGLTAEVAVNRLVIAEMNVEKISASARFEGTRAMLYASSFTLNGAPVNLAGTVDFAPPAMVYDLKFKADGVPIAPVVNTFMPERKGQYAGTFSGNSAIKGRGMGGDDFRQNLSGEIDFAVTNVNLSLANTRTPALRALFDSIVGLPELIRNPLAGVENLVGRLVNFGGQRGGWSDELMNAPIQSMGLRVKAASGVVTLESAEIQSSMFRASGSGQIMLATILTNSTLNIPISIALNRELAQQVGIAVSDASANAGYFPMPQFLEMTGTVGRPKTKTDKLVLGELALRTTGGVVKNIVSAAGESVGNVLQKGGSILGNIFGKDSSPTNAPTDTSTNKSKGTFDLFR